MQVSTDKPQQKGGVEAAATEPEYLKEKQERWQPGQSNPPSYPVTKKLGKGAWEEQNPVSSLLGAHVQRQWHRCFLTP